MARLHLTTTKVLGCVVVTGGVFQDHRGYFFESYKERDFAEVGLPIHWPQDNQSMSRHGVLRGLHIQRRNPQGKFVRCVRGALWDVCLDLRKESDTFMQWHAELLTGAKALYCPPGTAHGFVALEPDSIVYYKCTTMHDAETDGGVNALYLKIGWPEVPGGPIMSDKDKALPTVEEWLADPRGVFNG